MKQKESITKRWAVRALVLGALLMAGVAAAGPVAAQEFRQGLRAQKEAAGEEAEDAGELVQRPAALDQQYHRARTAWETGSSLLEAKARLDRVLQHMPDDWQSRKLRAQVLLEMDRPEAALADARRAAQLRPRDGEARLLYAEAARRNDQRERALKEMKAAAEHLSDSAVLHTRLSWNAFLLDRPQQAEAFARVALALDSTSAPAYRQLARVFAQTDRPAQAAAILARAVRSSVLNVGAIRSDDVLRPLLDRPALRGLEPRN